MSSLPLGYTTLPPGHLANVATCLEMTEPPPPRPAPAGSETLALRRFGAGDLAAFRALFLRVGQDLMWVSRLFMTDEELAATLGDPQVESYALTGEGESIGLLELDFRRAGECELSFFGLVPEAIGRGTGRYLMNEALARAWARPIRRFWVHTCTYDHPAALPFYQRSGFRPYAIQVEVHRDPRLTGHLPRHASPQVPIIEG